MQPDVAGKVLFCSARSIAAPDMCRVMTTDIPNWSRSNIWRQLAWRPICQAGEQDKASSVGAVCGGTQRRYILNDCSQPFIFLLTALRTCRPTKTFLHA